MKDGNTLWDGGEKSIGMGNPTLALAGTERGKQEALLRWLIAAEMGIEPAQNNVAYVLDQGMHLTSTLLPFLTKHYR